MVLFVLCLISGCEAVSAINLVLDVFYLISECEAVRSESKFHMLRNGRIFHLLNRTQTVTVVPHPTWQLSMFSKMKVYCMQIDGQQNVNMVQI